MWRQHKVDYDGLWTLLNRIPLEINGRFHASDINIAQLQMTNCLKKRGNKKGNTIICSSRMKSVEFKGSAQYLQRFIHSK